MLSSGQSRATIRSSGRFASALFAACMSLAHVTSAWANCDLPGQRYSTDRIADFLRDPPSLLKRYPNGGSGLSVDIRAMAAAGAATLSAAAKLVTKANIAQSAAIGHGLGRAQVLCQASDIETSRRIGATAAALSQPDFLEAYREEVLDNADDATAAGLGLPDPSQDEMGSGAASDTSSRRLLDPLNRRTLSIGDPFTKVQ